LLRIAYFLKRKIDFFSGGKPPDPNWGGHSPSQTPPLHSSQYLSSTFNLTPTPLLLYHSLVPDISDRLAD